MRSIARINGTQVVISAWQRKHRHRRAPGIQNRFGKLAIAVFDDHDAGCGQAVCGGYCYRGRCLRVAPLLAGFHGQCGVRRDLLRRRGRRQHSQRQR